MSGETTSCAPPEVEPATSRTASPLDFANALIAGPEPMKPASSELPSSAETSSGPALKVWVVSFVEPSSCVEVAVRHPDQRGGVGDVREVAEAQLGGRGPGGRRAGTTGGRGVCGLAPGARRQREHGDEREDQGRPEAEQGGAVHAGASLVFGKASGAAGRRPAGAQGRATAGAGRQRQNSSKACPRRDGQNRSRSAAALRVDAPSRPPDGVGAAEGSVVRTTPSCDASNAERQPDVRDAGDRGKCTDVRFSRRHLRRCPAARCPGDGGLRGSGRSRCAGAARRARMPRVPDAARAVLAGPPCPRLR